MEGPAVSPTALSTARSPMRAPGSGRRLAPEPPSVCAAVLTPPGHGLLFVCLGLQSVVRHLDTRCVPAQNQRRWEEGGPAESRLSLGLASSLLDMEAGHLHDL